MTAATVNMESTVNTENTVNMENMTVMERKDEEKVLTADWRSPEGKPEQANNHHHPEHDSEQNPKAEGDENA